MRRNVSAHVARGKVTHEGGPAEPVARPEDALRRAVVNCLLWEDTFYEAGNAIAARIEELVGKVDADFAHALAVEARERLGLRHAPLWVARAMAKHHRGNSLVKVTIGTVVQRADELAEFMALYWSDGRTPVSAQVKKGLAMAFRKFNAYQLAKYNRDEAIKLRDVMFIAHPKPLIAGETTIVEELVKKGRKLRGRVQRHSEGQGAIWRALIEGKLAPPDTWEVALSGGEAKGEAFARLLKEGKLGDLALLRNLRNMEQAGVERALVVDALGAAKFKGVLPFQFVAAWQYAPAFAASINDAAMRALAVREKRLDGLTLLLVDVSGSMNGMMSGRSKMTRMQAAGALAALLSAECKDLRVFTFSDKCVEVAAVPNLSMIDVLTKSQPHSATYLGAALQRLAQVNGAKRLVVFTDEQAHDAMPQAAWERAYIVNVAAYEPALDVSTGYTRINGFSERIADWIVEYEAGEAAPQ